MIMRSALIITLMLLILTLLVLVPANYVLKLRLDHLKTEIAGRGLAEWRPCPDRPGVKTLEFHEFTNTRGSVDLDLPEDK